ncbi:MAG: helix-turn-helix transcriptional regulator [Mycobacterium sp.]
MSRRVLRGFDPERFKELRKNGPVMGELARLSGVTTTTIYAWEKGTYTPQVDKLAAVMEVLGAPIEYVVRVPRDERYPGDWRVLLGVTQPKLASMAGIATSILNKIERGEVTLSKEKAVVLSQLVHASTEEYTAAWQRARTRPAGAPV